MPILITDDDRSSGLLVQALLQQMDLSFLPSPEICIFRTAEETLDYLKASPADSEKSADLMIIDVCLGGMNGIEFCRALRKIPDYQTIPVIMITGKVEKKLLKEAFEAGADDFIYKPLNKTEFHSRVRMVLLASLYQKIKERQRMELERINRQLEEKNKTIREQQARIIYHSKISALSRVAAGIAHEINNPLSYIYGNLEYIRSWISVFDKYLSQTRPLIASDETLVRTEKQLNIEDLSGALNSAIDGSLRIKEIISHFKDLSYYDEKFLGDLDVNQILHETVSALRAQYPLITVSESYESLPVIFGNRKVIYTCFWNILINAYEAIWESQYQGRLAKEDGQIQVKTAPVALGDEIFLEIRIADNGTGIPKEIHDKIFEPFFTTKTRTKNFGLGLYEVYNILQTYHAFIAMRPEQPVGTECLIKIPSAENQMYKNPETI